MEVYMLKMPIFTFEDIIADKLLPLTSYYRSRILVFQNKQHLVLLSTVYCVFRLFQV